MDVTAWFWDRLNYWFPTDLTRRRAAEERWKAHNARARAEGCPCGRPGEIVQYYHGNTGGVPVETWTCREHVGVSMWQRIGDGPSVPYWPRSTQCGECVGRCSTTWSALEPHTWHCRTPQGPSEFAAEDD